MGIARRGSSGHHRYNAPRPIDAADDVAAFSCGKPALDHFLKQRALRNEGKASRTYVVIPQSGGGAADVVAYYTLAAGALAREETPGWAKRNMPNPVPVIVVGRLAVDSNHQGRGLGRSLLREAMLRSLEASRQIGARALIVHAIDDEAADFYLPFGFQRFPAQSATLFLPIETIEKAL
ncbi:MAG TPA: GNAT family N-acetyltransferase [Sphingomicrobium sp.]|nr:GNAT family N-acetyltransferase [Sphingomicrobium sp.]